jgi:hypothetical protein
MRVFISWSGESSKHVAQALSDWIPDVLQQVRPFMSAEDIQAGTRWGATLGRKMEKCNFGISCITADNRLKPWIMFEAGALSKSLTASRVVPFLHKIGLSDLEGPLTQFQAVLATKDGTLRLLESIYETLAPPAVTRSRMLRAFERLWPVLEKNLSEIKDPDPKTIPPKRTPEQMLQEILTAIRDHNPHETSHDLDKAMWQHIEGMEPLPPMPIRNDIVGALFPIAREMFPDLTGISWANMNVAYRGLSKARRMEICKSLGIQDYRLRRLLSRYADGKAD